MITPADISNRPVQVPSGIYAKAERTSIQNLPLEMLTEIFKHIPPLNMPEISLVNKRFRAAFSIYSSTLYLSTGYLEKCNSTSRLLTGKYPKKILLTNKLKANKDVKPHKEVSLILNKIANFFSENILDFPNLQKIKKLQRSTESNPMTREIKLALFALNMYVKDNQIFYNFPYEVNCSKPISTIDQVYNFELPREIIGYILLDQLKRPESRSNELLQERKGHPKYHNNLIAEIFLFENSDELIKQMTTIDLKGFITNDDREDNTIRLLLDASYQMKFDFESKKEVFKLLFQHGARPALDLELNAEHMLLNELPLKFQTEFKKLALEYFTTEEELEFLDYIDTEEV